jgi:hypothetical protein
MALNPVITSLSFNSDATEATITDETTYGGAEFDRSEVAVFLQLWKMDEDEVETSSTIDNSTPDSSSTWVFDSETDGWYRALISIIPNWDVATAYIAGDVVYYTDGNIYECILASTANLPTDSTYFTAIEITDDAIEDADNVVNEYQDYLVIEQGKICAGTAAAEWYKSQDCSDCDKLDLASSMLKKRGMVIAAQRFAALSLYAKAESIARKLETDCESC